MQNLFWPPDFDKQSASKAKDFAKNKRILASILPDGKNEPQEIKFY
jgi:hypothetical protein